MWMRSCPSERSAWWHKADRWQPFHEPRLLFEHLFQVADFPLRLPAGFFCRPAIAQVRVPGYAARLFFHFAFRFPESALDFILCARFHENKIAQDERGGCNII